MLRKITKEIGRYKVGEVHDYPKAVWEKMAADGKIKLDKFTEEVEFNLGTSSLRGPIPIRRASA